MRDNPPQLVGIVGVGAIGSIMAKHLLAAGYDVVAWDRRPEASEAIGHAGGRAAASLAEVGVAGTVLSLVFDDEGVEEIAFGPGGLVETMAPGSCHMILSTISPGLSRRIYDRHLARNQRCLSASMFGRPEAAAAAQTLFNCSGPIDLYEELTPILQVLGRPRWVGPEPEHAMMIKIIGNNMIYAAVELLREMFDFLAAGGVSMQEAKESIVDRLFPGLIFQGYAELLMTNPSRPTATHPMQVKDSNLCMATARQAGVNLPVIEFLHDVARSKILRPPLKDPNRDLLPDG